MITDAQHLAARRADGTQRRELARALGDRDRQRVRDHERADEQCDEAEGEQEVLEERELVAGLLRASPWPDPGPVRTCVFGGRTFWICATRSLRGRTPGFAAASI